MWIRTASIAAVLLVAAVATAQAGAPPSKTEADVFTLPDFAPVEGASSRIVRTDRGASFGLRTSGLPARHALTLWLVIFNDPARCETPDACDLVDIDPGSPADVSVIYGAGRVVGPEGKANFAGEIGVGNIDRPSALPDDMQRLFGSGLTDPRGADLLLVAHDHTDVQPKRVAEQIHSFGVGCPDDDGFKCVDPQISYNSHLG